MRAAVSRHTRVRETGATGELNKHILLLAAGREGHRRGAAAKRARCEVQARRRVSELRVRSRRRGGVKQGACFWTVWAIALTRFLRELPLHPLPFFFVMPATLCMGIYPARLATFYPVTPLPVRRLV